MLAANYLERRDLRKECYENRPDTILIAFTGLVFSLGAASAQVEDGPDHWHKIYQLCLQQQATLRIEIARVTKEISTLNVENG